MKLCVYAGTFNPIHIAHLAVAQFIKDELGFDKILFIPSYNPPHRSNEIENELLPADQRFNLVKLAIKDNLAFDISDIEFQNEEKSYTYLTIKKLYETYQNEGKINFIIGTDALEKIGSWYEAEKLVELIRFVIVPRNENFDFNALFEKINQKTLLNIDYKIANAPFLDISSTLIRDRIKQRKSIKYLVTESVERYILDNRLFEKS